VTTDGSSRTAPGVARGTALLTASDVRSMVSLGDVITAVSHALQERSLGRIAAAARAVVPGGRTLVMAAASPELGGVAAKIISVAPGNRALGLTTIQGVATWLDLATTRPLVIADATALTALRTGALSALATQVLAGEGASTLAMIGAGGQALAQVEAICHVRPIKDVRVASQHLESAEALCEQVAKVFPNVTVGASTDVAGAVRGADIVCVATTATKAVLLPEDVRSHAHVNAVGAYRPDMKEVAGPVFAKAAVVCADDVDGALREGGDLMGAVSDGDLDPVNILELGLLLAAGHPAQAHRDHLTVFKSVGSSVADLAVLSLLAQRAHDRDDLRRVDFSA
jgi:ornithine cyclodeaminase